ncbi:serine hydrolase domain-containing protein [Kineococcus sp. LSe6-4]|uniref:Serine hydrolase domain-containing protein n=1 Tax=Kineococcus halophytocola TaxID=3234027 RepID=A0ABV4H1W7_9ACTN
MPAPDPSPGTAHEGPHEDPHEDPHEVLRAALADGVRDRLFSGATAAFAGADGRVHRAAAGALARDDDTPVHAGTRADLASLTKVFTAAAAHELAAVGALDLDRPTERGFTPRQLIAHTSGLPAESDVWRRTDLRPAQRLQRALDTPLVSAPGAVFRYSCVGYVTLGHLLEEATGQGLDGLVEEVVGVPLGARSLDWGLTDRPAAGPVLATETTSTCPTPRGVVHDELARSLARPAGNAGLFGAADDVLALGRALLAGTLEAGAALRTGDPAWMAGPAQRGHTGFTGTSLLLDPGTGACLVLLTNRVHPDRALVDLTPFRKSLARRLTARP